MADWAGMARVAGMVRIREGCGFGGFRGNDSCFNDYSVRGVFVREIFVRVWFVREMLVVSMIVVGTIMISCLNDYRCKHRSIFNYY